MFFIIYEFMNFYELIVIIKIENIYRIKKFLSIIKNIVNTNNCLIISIEQWGLKEFSYLIGNYAKGYYIYFNFKLNLNILNKINFYLKFNTSVIRFLIINLKKKLNNVNFFILKKIKIKIDKKILITNNSKKNFKKFFKLNK